MSSRTARGVLLLLGLVVAAPTFAQGTAPAPTAPADTERSDDATEPAEAAPAPSDRDVIAAIDRGMEYLLSIQREDGSWGGVKNATFTSGFANPATYHAWTIGTTALATLAMLEQGRSEEALEAARKGLRFLCENADTKRPADWDVDNNWGLVYGIRTLAAALRDPRLQEGDLATEVRAGARTMLAELAKYQSPRGGWGYYANPNSGWRPEWATSFMTAVAVIGIADAKAAGLDIDEKVFEAGVKAVETSKLPNGAYDYSVNALPPHIRMESINQVKGSLGRIQVCNVARIRGGREVPADEVEWGLEQFFRHHKFLETVRNKPIPHEGYYANAAYFYLFGHYYAAHAIEQLPEERRGKWARKLREPVMRTQQADGSMWDFWIAGSTKAYGTAFGVMTLAKTLDPSPEE